MVLRFLLINTLTFISFIFPQESRRDYDAELDYQSKAINNVRKEIEETRRRIKSEKKKEKSTARRLTNIDKEISLTDKLYAQLKQELGKNEKEIKKYADKFGATYLDGKRPWSVPCDVALPCATQNEISAAEAKTLVKNGCTAVAEGANMPSEPDAIEVFLGNKILFGPGKAANAGGVAVSGLEMSQNSMRIAWSREEVDQKLHSIMQNIHSVCVDRGDEGKFTNYVNGANIAGFIKVADAMIDQGVV